MIIIYMRGGAVRKDPLLSDFITPNRTDLNAIDSTKLEIFAFYGFSQLHSTPMVQYCIQLMCQVMCEENNTTTTFSEKN